MKIVARYSKPEEAYLVASVLEGNGIAVNVRDAHTVNIIWMYSNAIGGVKVEVAEEDYERAREILDLPKEESPLLVCPKCGSKNVKMRELNLFTAIGVFIGLLIPISSRKVDCFDCNHSFAFRSKGK